MYCPRCATENTDTTKYCRSCGANLSLIPHALQGALPAPVIQVGGRARGKRRGYENPMASGIRSAFMGAGFLLLALALIVTNQHWGVWMLIPGFTMLGKGAADIFNARSLQSTPSSLAPTTVPPVRRTGDLAEVSPPPSVGAMPPASVTEQTARYLEEKAERIK